MTRFKFHGTGETVSGGGPVLLIAAVLVLSASGAAAAVARTVEGALLGLLGAAVLSAVVFSGYIVSLWRRPRMVHVTRVLPPAAVRELPAKQAPQIVNHFHGGQHVHAGDATPAVRRAAAEDHNAAAMRVIRSDAE